MIKFQELVPRVYPNASRDFQYISRLIDVVLNDVKHNVDQMKLLPNNVDDVAIIDLLALTFGFKVKHNYDKKQLTALVNILPRAMKYKGSKKAIDLIGEAILSATGINGTYKSAINGYTLEITLPKGIIDITLLIDLLPYLLPAGMNYRIIRNTEIASKYITRLAYSTDYKAKWVHDKTLATMFEPKEQAQSFTNFTEDGEANVGLLANTVIPTLVTTSQEPEDTQK